MSLKVSCTVEKEDGMENIQWKTTIFIFNIFIDNK